ncbi:MAG: CoB--CoM heterodisulfide reductase iron-sulfur subunit A family protein [Candidatus Lokiarchaeota archaeon]|nr:CoB--CoM heterodisulfide reductase iron-sulfur subunit A family protein [Candidatus Lokiarchaeota archaeon]
MEGAVLVIGAGIAGIQTSLDLTELGFKVYLVEKSPSIGGRMAQLDKTFPTNDCSLCILAPKMVEVYRNPNIELMTYHEVKAISGEAGNFDVTVLKKPRYIDEEKCKGCGDCAAKCPKIQVPNLFDMNLGKRKSVYIPFPQAVPPIYLIDPELCLMLTKGVCGVCEKVCEAKAINYEQKEEDINIKVGAVVVATGFDMPAEELSPRWGYRFQNVVSALEYERILCASGPFGGHVLRLSDEEEPEKIAFIQCAGSRDLHENVPYCSSVCCMYTAKEAIITAEHSEKAKCFVFRHDIRAYGKNFYEFTQRAQEEYGVKYFQTKISTIEEDPETNDLIIHYEDLKTGEFNDFRANLVVLATPLVPKKGIGDLAKILEVELDKYDFFKEKTYFNKSLSSREGIFLCGFCQGPMDIPETVADASGVASQVATLLNTAKFTKVKEKVFDVAEKEVSPTDEPRIGVLVCHCGINIGKYVDVPNVRDYTKSLPNVVWCEDNLYSCSSDSQELIKEKIKEHNLNRLIVASCTPRTHEPLFQETCQEAGMNKYLFEMVNIRDQCSWVHMTEKEAATDKSMDLIRMAVSKSKLIKPQKEEKIAVIPTALVIGGGISGMTASLELANQGFKTYVIEKETKLGGNLNKLNILFPIQEDASIFLKDIISKVESNNNIEVHLETTIKDVKGYIGNYEVSISDSKDKVTDLKTGAIIVATGGQEFKPNGLFQYDGKNKQVMTQLEVEQKLQEADKSWLDNLKRITFVLCAGARQKEGITYCSNVCCGTSIKNINILKELNPNLEIVVVYRDFQMAKKEFEEYYRNRRKDAMFLRYDLDHMPKITKVGKSPEKYKVEVFDTNLQDNIDFETDLIVLATPMIPADNLKDLAMMLKVPLDRTGFFLEAHVKLRPLDFATDGIFLCGVAQWPKNIQDSISQASGAAGRASRFLSAGEITTSGLVAEVNESKCIGCGDCEEVCPYKAIELTETTKEFEDVTIILKKSFINSALCKGCGTCAATCPVGAIGVKHYDFDQIGAMIDSYLLEKIKNGGST